MPCDQVIRRNVALAVADLAVLHDALQAHTEFRNVFRRPNAVHAFHGPTGQTVVIRDGAVQVIRGTEHIADTIKQAYTQQAIRVAAKRYGWTVTPHPTDPQRVQIVRR